MTEVILPSHDEIQKCAYLLWEECGKPQEHSNRFWNEAVNLLTPKQWYITSGELKVSGFGKWEDIVSLAIQSGADEGLSFWDVVYVSDVGFFEGSYESGLTPIRYNLWSTQYLFKKFGLWN